MSEPVLSCKQCKRDRLATMFLWNGRRGKIRVRLCNDCAGANMKRYWTTQVRNMKADTVTAVDD